MNADVGLDPDRLAAFGAEVLGAVGVPEDDALLVSDSLVTADLWGHPSHGMLRLGWYGCGHLVLALRIDALLDPAEFDRRIDDLIATTKAVPLAGGVDEILYPGEPENRAEERGRRERVVVLPERTVEELAELARSCGVQPVDGGMS
jgi:LDH2 family malate/lactate/ureidoglycolate dehydrogenase